MITNKANPDFIDIEEKKQMFEKLKQRQKRSYKRKNPDLVKN
jgi:hypothetical protein